MPPTADYKSDALLFEAVIVPHRSLSPRGVRVLLAALGLLVATIALRFAIIGAWLVLPFSVVEAALVMLLVWRHATGPRASELVLLSENALRIIRTDPRGRHTEHVLQPAWMRVVLDERPGRIPALFLAAGRAQEEVGACLGASEKRDLANALRTALHQMRNPVFENPQLRD